MISFALNPLIKEVISLQSEKPKGMNRKAIFLENNASIESFGLLISWKDKLKCCKHQMRILEI